MRRADVRACKRILWRASRSFATAALLLPPRLRGATAAIYAFCRVSDDAADEAADPAAALERMRERLERVYRGAPVDHPVDRAFADVVAHAEIPRAVPEALFEGFAWDLEGRRYPDLEALEGYCARVASTVGVMMTLLMGRRRPDVLARACDLGIAMQLTNIARDVGEDAGRGRLYLPDAWLRGRGVDPDRWLAAPTAESGVRDAVRALLAEADRRYALADAGIGALPFGARFAIAAARHIYAAIGQAVAARGYDSVTGRAYTTGARKLWLVGRAFRQVWRRSDPDRLGAPPSPAARFLIEAVG